jgi:hypothetical protein
VEGNPMMSREEAKNRWDAKLIYWSNNFCVEMSVYMAQIGQEFYRVLFVDNCVYVDDQALTCIYNINVKGFTNIIRRTKEAIIKNNGLVDVIARSI